MAKRVKPPTTLITMKAPADWNERVSSWARQRRISRSKLLRQGADLMIAQIEEKEEQANREPALA